MAHAAIAIDKNGYGTIPDNSDEPKWDYVMVFPNPPRDDPDPEDQRDNIILKLRATGFETKLYYSTAKELVFCKLRVPEDRLKSFAEKMKLRMLLDADELARTAKRGIPEKNIKPFRIRDVKNSLPYSPYEYIYAPYTRALDIQRFFKHKGPNGSLFGATERMVIIEHMITDPAHGAAIDLERLIYECVVQDCFPLHDQAKKAELAEKWMRWTNAPMNQPFEEIWEYYGVKVALYFLFLGHCTKWLTYPALVGIVPSILNLAPVLDDQQHKAVFTYLSPIFGALMVIWMTVYLNNWKRANARACLRWGTTDYEEAQTLRPQFIGEPIPSPIDGTPTRWFSPREKLKRVALSWFVNTLLMGVVIAIVVYIFILNYDLSHGEDAEDLTIRGYKIGPMIAALANSVQITVMGKLHYYVSIFLINNENHRTDVDYENSMIIKSVVFQFVNNFSALIYVAFIKEDIEGTCTRNCMWELRYTYLIVYLSRLLTSNFTEVAIPRFWMYFNRFLVTGNIFERDHAAVRLSAAERELFLAQYDWLGTFTDYLEMVIQFGFTTMFVVAFPLSPLFSYLTNYFEIRLDAYRVLYESRRPRPLKVKDMGYWYPILQVLAGIAICTNGGVVIFTGAYFTDVTTSTRVWLFTLFISAMFLLKVVLEACIDDTPEGVRAQARRQDFLVGKCLYHVPDEDRRRTPDALRKDLQNPEAVFAIADEDDDE